MKSVIKLFSLCFAIFLISSTAFAQNRPTQSTFGLTASIQGNQTNLQVPIWLNDNVTIAPVFGINHQQNNFTSINLGVAPRFYQDVGSDFATYLGARGIIQRTSPEVGAEDSDFLLGATGGGEYFLGEHFSLGVEVQLNFLINDNGNDRFGTGAAVMGTYYF
ncbi:hypothetical protein [Fodinibius sp. Rm-B-1B1-1]|uniref:hypothetical protein n=1 Tax=Fodinibius alkaliphilus TaxID=3140241 RepID=UPI003159994B